MSESEFIKKSQHAEMTRAVQSHFDAGSGPAASYGLNRGNGESVPGDASGKGYPLGGTDAWNSHQSDTGTIESAGNINNQPYGVGAGPSQFNVPGQTLPRETGVNYKPLKNAGHSLKEDPFQIANGLVGGSWK